MVKMEDILEMSVADRMLMIEKIWDSLDHEQLDLPGRHQQELDRRLARYERGETSFVTWESIKKELNTGK